MAKRFVGKKRRKKIVLKFLAFFIIVLISFFSCFSLLTTYVKKNMSKEEIVDFLFTTTMGNNKILNFLEMNPTEFLLSSTLGIEIPESELVFHDEEETGIVYEYVPDPSPNSDANNPLIYIYNTHQTEGYKKDGLSEYDIIPTVLFASYYLREKLNDYSLPSIVETTEISEILRINNWSYSHSYEASRYLLQNAIDNHKSLRYFIDLHRDSIPYEKSTIEWNGKKYAKVLFVVGKEHSNFEQNLALATNLNEKISLKINGISRGVIGKEGANVNGIYNQDINPNVLLIEVGGQYNSMLEVTNTLEVLSSILKEYIEENS